MRRVLVFCWFVLTSGAVSAWPGDDARVVLRGARVSAPVTPTVVDLDLRALPKPPEWHEGDPVRDVEESHDDERRGPGRPPATRAEPLEDALLALPAVPLAPDPTFGTPLRSFAGRNFTGVVPADPVGDVGPNHYVQATNGGTTGTEFTVFSKTGTTIAGPTRLGSLAQGVGNCADGLL